MKQKMKNSGSKIKKRKSASGSRKRNQSAVNLISGLMDDENTTNSEASEHVVFSDINWEENLEVDTTSLLEEFAPQTIQKPSKTSLPETTEADEPLESKNNPKEKVGETAELDLGDVESPSDFHIGLKLLILNYKTNQWIEGFVEEIDYEEEEILVKYVDGDDSPEEWISMKSQRVKKKKTSQTDPILLTPKESPDKSVISTDVVKSPVLSSTEPSTSPPSASSTEKPLVLTRKIGHGKKKKMSIKKVKGSLKKPPFKKSISKSLASKGNQRRALQITRRLPVWKSHVKQSSASVASASSAKSAVGSFKFVEGEKVLAKWSDHRMQKFPAVIKTVCGDRLYEVLFYDGFLKTIIEDNIYKTTEEEMAKYKESKPSEADSFVDVDLTSKHERRQKKRKIFDGFFEEKDFKRPKKMESFDLNRSESFLRASLSRNKPAIQSFSVHAKRVPGGTTKPSSLPSKGLQEFNPQNSPSRVQEVQSNGKDNVPVSTQQSNIDSTVDSISKKVEIKLHDIKHDVPKKDSASLPQALKVLPSVQPLEITCHDGTVRKSILIEDDQLPPGWSKHVISWVENAWACFLFTPDRYAVHSVIELRKYFRMSEGQEPPDGLDFSFPKDSLSELAEAQCDLIPRADYRKWVNKILDERKVMKKVRILPPSRSIGPGNHFGTKRVRTLLPRYRSHTFNQNISGKTVEGKVWGCPKSDCSKKFRKENLLQMHIKHYHRELSELAGSAPNVVDLALARTSADGIFTSEPSKRNVSKSPMYELSDKTLESSSAREANGEPKMSSKSITPLLSGPSNAANSNSNNNGNIQATIPAVSTSIKVLTPNKHAKPRLDVETDSSTNDKKGVDKVHYSFGTPKVFSRKSAEVKHSEESSYIAGSRSFKKKQQTNEKLVVGDSSNDGKSEEDSKDDGVILERLQNEEVINCICGFKEEDGLMVQCEICLCWQHGACHSMDKDSDVPERYVCSICLDPIHVRSSQRYSYANHYLTLTKLPRFRYRTCKEDILRHRERILSKSFELTSNLQSIHKMERALTAKINIAQQSDHPKLYLWSTNWDSTKKKHTLTNSKKTGSDLFDKGRRGPIGEAPIESIDCRLRLLDRIEADQQDIESRLTIVQAQLQALESEDFELGGEESDVGGGDPLLKQAIYMLLRDLSTIATATSLS